MTQFGLQKRDNGEQKAETEIMMDDKEAHDANSDVDENDHNTSSKSKNEDQSCKVEINQDNQDEKRKEIQLKKMELLSAIIKSEASTSSSCCLRTFIFLLCFFYILSFTCFILSPFVTFERTHSRTSTNDVYNFTLKLTPNNTALHNRSSWNFDFLPRNETSESKLKGIGEANLTEIFQEFLKENFSKAINNLLLDKGNQNEITNFGDENNKNLKQGSGVFSGDFDSFGKISGDFEESTISTTKNRKTARLANSTKMEMDTLEQMVEFLVQLENVNGGNFSLTTTKENLYDHEFFTLHIGFNEFGTLDIILRFGVVLLGTIPLVIVRKLFWQLNF